MEISVKKAQLKDIYLIHQINQKVFTAYQQFYPNGVVPALTETIQQIREDLNSKTVLIAWYGDKIVGSIRYHFINHHSAYVSRFSILSEYQKLGIGTKLINEVIEQLKEKNGHFLALHAHYNIKSVLQFYLKNGFHIEKIALDRGYPRAYLYRKIEKGGRVYETVGR